MDKPKIPIARSILGKWMNVIALLSLISSGLYLWSQWPFLPERVPTHYDVMGEPDHWNEKGFIVIPLLIGTVIWIGLNILEKYPHLHNYTDLTPQNTERKYKNSSLMMNFLKNEILLIFSFSSLNDVQVAKGNASLLGVWELPIVLLVLLGTIGFFVYRSYRLK